MSLDEGCTWWIVFDELDSWVYVGEKWLESSSSHPREVMDLYGLDCEQEHGSDLKKIDSGAD
ncbi:hypothetical protein BOX17_12325 [Halomonas aestuarii]|uniref:Uncharacterized protein n=1 Tax=Halomonas aestuarii TaxID=1897729 RepID=A0A1J0VI48_9GAMM|nr:hypothetical protein BOX17_12325 [Halomonas aestuarii]